MDFAPKNWIVPHTNLGDRLLLVTEGGGSEDEVVALTASGLARVQLSDGTLTSVPVTPDASGKVFRLYVQ